MRILIYLFIFLFTSAAFAQEDVISSDLLWSERMALSVMKRNPEPWMIDFMDKPVWSYPQGFMLLAIQRLWEKTEDPKYFDYINAYGDKLIPADGSIDTYKIETFNLDMINSGKILFLLYDKTGEKKYKVALETLRNQLRWQPRTHEGGFWHKARYPWQMWLDGAYMASPFLAQYAVTFDDAEAFDDCANQLIMMNNHLRDSKTGLLYHGYDESRLLSWSDSTSGHSPNFWGRAMGWYAMAIVDVLDYFPKNHAKYNDLVSILQQLTQALASYQDETTHLWYQVVDTGDREGNYLEASASSMFVYAIAKGVKKGYLQQSYLQVAQNGLEGLLKHLIKVEDNGLLNLIQVCAVAGLGNGRDGTFDYYVNEKIRTNDPKGVAPFIMACLELDR